MVTAANSGFSAQVQKVHTGDLLSQHGSGAMAAAAHGHAAETGDACGGITWWTI